MLEILKQFVKATFKDATDEQITSVATAIEKSGKLVPEAKYLETKKAKDTAEGKITELQTSLDAFGDLNPEDAAKAAEELKTLQQKVADDKQKADDDAKTANQAKHTKSVREAFVAKLKESGAVDAELVADQAITKAGGAGNIEFNEDGTLKQDITFAIEHVKTAHPTNFTKKEGSGGGSGAGAGGGEHSSWTADSAKTWREGKSDQEVLDNARSDEEFAKAAGLESHYQKPE